MRWLSVALISLLVLLQYPLWIGKGGWLRVWDVDRQLQQQRVALFDGTSAFAVGTDDSLRNMRWRLERTCGLHPLGQIVIEIFDRLQQESNPNVYARFKQRHQRERTRWW